MWPAAAFLNGSEDEAYNVLATLKQKNDEWADVARAYVLALSEDEVEKTESLEVFDRLKSQIRTWFGMHTLIQIPLLAGEPGLARQQCMEWRENESGREGIDNDSWWEKESIYFLATGISEAWLWTLSQWNRTGAVTACGKQRERTSWIAASGAPSKFPFKSVPYHDYQK